MLKDKFVFT